jgi:hypothetical protein
VYQRGHSLLLRLVLHGPAHLRSVRVVPDQKRPSEGFGRLIDAAIGHSITLRHLLQLQTHPLEPLPSRSAPAWPLLVAIWSPFPTDELPAQRAYPCHDTCRPTTCVPSE